MNKHVVCFRNLYNAFMYELPLLTVSTTMAFAVAFGSAVVYFLHGGWLFPDGDQHLGTAMFLTGLIGTAVSIVLFILVSVVIPTVWKEITSIPAAIKRALACKGY